MKDIPATETILGLDIGGTHFRMGLVNREYRVQQVEVHSSRALFERSDPLAALAAQVKTYLTENARGSAPAMVCAGLPAVLDHSRRRVWSATNFPAMAGRDIVAFMEAELQLPVVIEHDAYYLLAYDLWERGLENRGTMMGCYFGTGLGNAVYINGEPYIGKNGVACELGHMPVPLSERPCSCGNTGCVEMYSCGKAMEMLAKEQFPGEPISELFEKHPQNDALRNFMRYMASAVATEVNILDPDGVFLGGGLVQMKGFPRAEFTRAILDNVRKPYPADNLQMFFSTSAPENGVIGAAIEGFRRMAAKR